LEKPGHFIGKGVSKMVPKVGPPDFLFLAPSNNASARRQAQAIWQWVQHLWSSAPSAAPFLFMRRDRVGVPFFVGDARGIIHRTLRQTAGTSLLSKSPRSKPQGSTCAVR
jgi:hypothetical protein